MAQTERSSDRQPPRYVPDLGFPPYAFVPGQSPHPVSDPRGHRFGKPPERSDAPDPEDWRACRPYLYGIDLFNAGFYWEAHEAWESLWHACGRSGFTGRFLKGLIKLAAAGVKAREGKPLGVQNHAQSAAQLFGRLTAEMAGGRSHFMGLSLPELHHFAIEVCHRPPMGKAASGGPVEVVFHFVLEPG
jgi:hypothetical protein